VLVQERYGDAVKLGAMVAAFGAGTLAGTLGFAALGPRLPRRRTVLTAICVAGLPLWIVAGFEALAIVLLALFVMGLGIGPISPIVTTAMHERVPAELRGRVFGAWMAIAMSSIPLGILVTGFIIEAIGITATIVVLATAFLGVIASAFLNPAIREIEHVPEPEAGLAPEVA
jgi:MFS family permease